MTTLAPLEKPVISILRQSRKVTEWNRKYKPGQTVQTRGADGVPVITTTRSVAWLLVDLHPVVLLDGVEGAQLLDFLTPV